MNTRQGTYDGLIFGNKIALIHKAKRELGMEEIDYRAVLLRTAGVASSSAITISQFDAVMSEFRRLGFVDAPPKRKPKLAAGSSDDRPSTRQWKLLEDRARQVGYEGLSDPRFIAWMKPRGHVEHPRFLNKLAIQRVIAALGNWLQRKTQKAKQ